MDEDREQQPQPPEPAAETPPVTYTCPGCSHEIPATPGPAAQLVACPQCSQPLLVPALDGSTDLPEEESSEEARQAKEDELSALKIRQLTVAKRSAIRMRSYFIIAVLAAVIASVQLVLNAIGRVQLAGGRIRGRPLLYFAAAALALVAAGHFFRRAVAMHRVARQSAFDPDFRQFCEKCGYDLTGLPSGRCPRCRAEFAALRPPEAPPEPDFTPLSDGSQHWKNLDEVR